MSEDNTDDDTTETPSVNLRSLSDIDSFRDTEATQNEEENRGSKETADDDTTLPRGVSVSSTTDAAIEELIGGPEGDSDSSQKDSKSMSSSAQEHTPDDSDPVDFSGTGAPPSADGVEAGEKEEEPHPPARPTANKQGATADRLTLSDGTDIDSSGTDSEAIPGLDGSQSEAGPGDSNGPQPDTRDASSDDIDDQELAVSRRFLPSEAPKIESPPSTITLGTLTVDYSFLDGETNEPVIHLFGRVPTGCVSTTQTGDSSKASETDDTSTGETADRGGDLEHVVIHGKRPYFYVPDEQADRNLRAQKEVVNTEPGYETIRGRSVTKVETRIPKDVKKLRDDYDHYEADVLFSDRFLVDEGALPGVTVPERRDDEGRLVVGIDEVQSADCRADPRVHIVDLEVEDRNGFPDEDDATEPIRCLTSHDSQRDEYVVWAVRPPASPTEQGEPVPSASGGTGRRSDSSQNGGDPDAEALLESYEFTDESGSTADDVEVRWFDDEVHLLVAYLTYIQQTDPDVVAAWSEFDGKYLVNRLDRLDAQRDDNGALDPDRLSRIDEVWSSGWGLPRVKGRVMFDLLKAYKRMQRTDLDSYRLDAVAKNAIGVGKETFDGDFGALWESDVAQFLRYNLRDVELCVALANTEDLIPFWSDVADFVGCQLGDAPIAGPAVDKYILRKASREGLVLPSKGAFAGESDENDVTGGTVFEPVTGVQEMVATFDLASLYPMAMHTLNASPETGVEDPDNCDVPVAMAPSGQAFRLDEDGMTRELIDELLAERNARKKQRDAHSPDSEAYALYDRQQAAVKVIMNALFGVSAWDQFRLYDPEMSEAVTSTGRAVIEYTADIIQERGYSITYGDTDSCLISLGEDISREAAIEVCTDLEATINEAYDEFARDRLGVDQHRFEVEFEKLYRRFLQAGKKKRYAGSVIYKDGKQVEELDITGFEHQRSDSAPITREVQEEVIHRIVTGDSTESIREYLHSIVIDFRRGNIDLEKILIPEGINQSIDSYTRDTKTVKGAKYANLLLGTSFQQGDKPRRVYLARVDPAYFDRIEEERGLDAMRSDLYGEFKREREVICVEHAGQLPDAFQVDWDTMLEKTIRSPLGPILSAIGLNWADIRDNQQQTGIGDFI